MIAVSGTDQSDGLHPNSNYGSEVELTAPYEVITLEGTSGTAQWNGTSFAAPAVSGTAALIWSLHPGWTNQQVRSWLHSTARDLGPHGVDDMFGSGMVDAEAAVGVDVEIAGPSVVPPDEFCTWQVFVDGAAGSVSQQWSGVLSGTGSFVSGSLSRSLSEYWGAAARRGLVRRSGKERRRVVAGLRRGGETRHEPRNPPAPFG